MKKALAGVKVVEFCDLAAGPFCAKLLADLGAEVIKVERPGCGDKARSRGPFVGDAADGERSCLFLYVNTNKMSVTLDVDTSAGRAVFKDLVKQADILLEDKAPRFMKAHGLDFKSLSALNPGLVVTSITPFGETGPYRNYKAYPLNVYQAGGDGFLLQSGPAYNNRPPTRAGSYAGEYEAAIYAAGATLAALFARAAIGKGQHVDCSKQEALMMLNRNVLARYPIEGVVEDRSSRQYDAGGIYAVKDGYIMIMPMEEHQWQGMMHMMGDPAWASDPRFKTRQDRGGHRDEINAHVIAWMKEHTKEEVYQLGQANSVPTGPFYSPQEVLQSEQLKSRQFFVECKHPAAGKVKMPVGLCKMAKTPISVDSPAPLLGQHNHEVFGERLGRSAEDRVKLHDAGAI
ncbi:MAG: CoA transferase [Chloroflexi bacterium]|nr:CoA transferase [Chloroflexota bacterium]